MATLSYSTTPHLLPHHHHHCYHSPSSSLSLAFLSPPPLSSSLLKLSSSNSKKPAGPTSSFVPKFSTAAEVMESPVVETESSAAVEADPVVQISKQEPVPEIFAVVMTGGRQYIVIPGRFLYIQRLKGANVNDKVILNKVLLVGTKTCTYVGKPIVHNAAVHAVVEEQGLDPKVIVYKYKKKKNYRRNIGHRQPNTRIRILGITGYENYPASTLPEGFVSQD